VGCPVGIHEDGAWIVLTKNALEKSNVQYRILGEGRLLMKGDAPRTVLVPVHSKPKESAFFVVESWQSRDTITC